MSRPFQPRSIGSVTGWAQRMLRKAPSQPLRFNTSDFETIPASVKVDEEHFKDFLTNRYYPVRIGETMNTKYQIVGKLGFGLGSTVWLANDLHEHQSVALKVFTNDRQNREETIIYQHLNSIKSSHPGRRYIRDMLDTFTLQGPKGEHHCIVHTPMWESARELLDQNPNRWFAEDVLKAFVYRLLQALEYLHTEADISAQNILMEIVDQSIVPAFIKAEQEHPSPRKTIQELDGYTVYVSREFDLPENVGEPILCDFGSAVIGDREHRGYVQPDVYRAPEVCMEMPWKSSADIWNVGVLIWDLFEGRHMFCGLDPKEDKYMTRALLSEMIAMIGPPPLDFLKRGDRVDEFFTGDGQWRGIIPIPTATSLEESEERLVGDNKVAFLQFIRKMLQWKPEDRQTAKQLLQDPWLNSASEED